MSDDMQVVLLQDVAGLGSAGDIKEVADGHGRNYLIPRGLAQFASPSAMKRIEEQRRAEARRQEAAEAELSHLAEVLDGAEVVVKAKVGAQGRLYGAVTNSDIAESIAEAIGQPIDKRKVELGEPIHQTGQYDVPVRLGKDLVPTVRIVVEGDSG